MAQVVAGSSPASVSGGTNMKKPIMGDYGTTGAIFFWVLCLLVAIFFTIGVFIGIKLKKEEETPRLLLYETFSAVQR